MSEEKKAESTGNNFIVDKFYEFRGEFRKIVWPDRETLIKHTITVVAVSLIFGALITLMDFVFGIIFSNFTQLLV